MASLSRRSLSNLRRGGGWAWFSRRARPGAKWPVLVYRLINSVMIIGKSGALPGKDAQQSGGLLRDRHGEAHCMRVPGSTSRTRTQPAASSGWRDRMVICETVH